MASKKIRRATTEDVPILTRIRNNAHQMKLTHRDYAWGKEGDGFSEKWVRTNVSERTVYIAEMDGEPVGTFVLDLDDEKHWGPQEPIAGYVHGLCVRAGFNGHALGRFMLEWCGAELGALDRRLIRLDCAAHNVKLCAYYVSLGFTCVGQYVEHEADGYVWSLYEKAAESIRGVGRPGF